MQRTAASNSISTSTPGTPSRLFSPARPSILIDKAKFAEINKFMSSIDTRLEQISTDNKATTKKLDNIQSEINTLKSLPGKIVAIENNFKKLSNDVIDLSTSHETVKANCSNLQKELKHKFAWINDLNSNSDVFDSVNHDRKDTEIIISGCPKMSNESTTNILKILGKIASVLSLPYLQTHIFSVFCVLLKKETPNRGSGPIIVRFTSALLRDEWITAKKQKRDLKASEIDSSWGDSIIYINESATSTEREIFSLTRDFPQTNKCPVPFKALKRCSSLIKSL